MVVLLEPAPSSFSNAWKLDISQLGDASIERSDCDARHVVVRGSADEFRLWLRGVSHAQPLAIVLPLDGDLPVRTEAALRLWARIANQGTDEAEESLALTRQRRDRLVLMLRALDGHLSEASYREIAEALFGSRRVEHEPWKTSSLRDRTIRLVKSGVALMRAGYRRLLRGR